MTIEGEEPTESEQPEMVESSIEKLLDEEKKRSQEYLANLRYLQADFENYRKRNEREAGEVEESTARKLIIKLLSVVDELELAITHADASADSGAYLDGIRMVYKNLMSILESEGLRAIEPIGKPFDPEIHEAVEKVEGNGEADIVVQEVRKGFTFRDKVIRPSMVKVEMSNRKTEEKKVVPDEQPS